MPRKELEGVILPSMHLSSEGLSVAVDLMRMLGDDAALAIELKLVRFDAPALRILADARDSAAEVDARSRVEAVRQFAEVIPDDVVMSALLREGSGVSLAASILSRDGLDDATARSFCHALFGAGLATGHETAALDLGTVYPRRFALDRLTRGIASAARRTLARAVPVYEPPATGGVTLGAAMDGGRVVIGEYDRAVHQIVIGATGTGKSTLLLNQVAADMNAGKGLLLVDPHGDLWQAAVGLVPTNRRDDLVLAHLGDPRYAFTMNVLSGMGANSEAEMSATVNALLRLFKNSLWPGVPEAFGPMFEMYFTQAMLLVMEAEGGEATILDFERVFRDEEFRRSAIERCSNRATVDFWQKTVSRITHDEISLNNMAPYVISKLSPFTTNRALAPILGARHSSLDLKAAIAGGKIVLINLAKGFVGAGAARLVGTLIAMRLVAAAQAQSVLAEDERKVFVAYLDEFQTYATENIAEAIEETRKYRLRLVLACQSLGQVDGAGGRPHVGASILANVGNLVSFRVGVDDARRLAPWFEPAFRYEDLLYLPNHMALARLLVAGRAVQPVEFRSAPPPAVRPMTD
jgi:hypothetical protein